MTETTVRSYRSQQDALRAQTQMRQQGWDVFSVEELKPRLRLHPPAVRRLWYLVHPPRPRIIVAYVRVGAGKDDRRARAGPADRER